MTPKDKAKETLLEAGYDPAAVAEAVANSDLTKLAPKPVSLDGMTADAALSLLKSLRAKGGTVLVDAPVGRPTDAVVVDAHAFTGEWRSGRVWWFHPPSFDMACRVAGWSKVERDGEKWRLS